MTTNDEDQVTDAFNRSAMRSLDKLEQYYGATLLHPAMRNKLRQRGKPPKIPGFYQAQSLVLHQAGSPAPRYFREPSVPPRREELDHLRFIRIRRPSPRKFKAS